MNYWEAVRQCYFLRGKSLQDVQLLFEMLAYSTGVYDRGDIIFRETEPADKLAVVLSGRIEVQKIYPTGKTVTIARFGPGETVADAVLFSKARLYPATVAAAESPTRLLFLPRSELLKLFALDAGTMTLFMESLSQRIVLLNQKIEILSLGTLRQRIAHMLLKEMRRTGSSQFVMAYSKRVWAEHLGVQRPSLSRELCRMRDDGWIAFTGNVMTILDTARLESALA